LVSTEFSEGTDVDVEQNFVEMGDIELPDVDSVQCGSEFCVICNELLRDSGKMKGYPYDLDSQNLDSKIPRRYLNS